MACDGSETNFLSDERGWQPTIFRIIARNFNENIDLRRGGRPDRDHFSVAKSIERSSPENPTHESRWNILKDENIRIRILHSVAPGKDPLLN
jgi:hypothetical protein